MRGFLFLFFCIFAFTVFSQPIPVFTQLPTPSPSVTPSPPPERSVDEIDLIHFGDVIDVDFAGGFEFDWRGTLSPEGNLDGFDSYSEPIFALCRSEADAAASIEQAFSRILRSPKVTVKIIDRSNRAVVQLEGAVRTPSRFQLRRSPKLRELIVLAGGFTDEASGEIEILRPPNLNCMNHTSAVGAALTGESGANGTAAGNGLQVINIKIKDILAGIESADPLILNGDLIKVLKAEPIYVIGAVNNPGRINAHTGMTLTRVIDSAGGLAKGAESDRVVIFRREGNETNVIPVDLEKVKSGQLDDVNLQAFDILEVTFKNGGKRKYPPVITSRGSKQANAAQLPLKIIE